MDRNPQRHVPIKTLAKQYGIGETALKGCFKSVYSMGIYSYLKKRRVRVACECLSNGKDSILEIANQLGYSNPGKFSAAFKESVGTTPLKYRKFNPLIQAVP